MALKIKGNGKIIAIWLVVTAALAMIGGAVTGALVGGAWPGYVVAGVGAGCVIWLIQKLDGSPKPGA